MTVGLLWALRICEIALELLMKYVFADMARKPSPNYAWLSGLTQSWFVLPRMPTRHLVSFCCSQFPAFGSPGLAFLGPTILCCWSCPCIHTQGTEVQREPNESTCDSGKRALRGPLTRLQPEALEVLLTHWHLCEW